MRPLPYGTDQIIDAAMARSLHADTCRDHALVAWIVLWVLPAYPERFAARLARPYLHPNQAQERGAKAGRIEEQAGADRRPDRTCEPDHSSRSARRATLNRIFPSGTAPCCVEGNLRLGRRPARGAVDGEGDPSGRGHLYRTAVWTVRIRPQSARGPALSPDSGDVRPSPVDRSPVPPSMVHRQLARLHRARPADQSPELLEGPVQRNHARTHRRQGPADQ